MELLNKQLDEEEVARYGKKRGSRDVSGHCPRHCAPDNRRRENALITRQDPRTKHRAVG
jgi:hypothetical protein